MIQLILQPNQLNDRDTLKIRMDEGSFPKGAYRITNESGKIIRKGMITNELQELSLRIVGFKTGIYTFLLGNYQKSFIVH